MKKIAIQGVPGSYHDIAAHKFFPGEEIELICCSTFEEVFANIKQDSNVIGMLAIENTIAGSLLHNYELLRESGMTIVGEHKLRIKHSFMCLPDDNWETLTERGKSLIPHIEGLVDWALQQMPGIMESRSQTGTA
jgi:prephenate dehydratase